MKADLCPVCMGKGLLCGLGEINPSTKCHGCGGRGWVEVNENEPQYIFSEPLIKFYEKKGYDVCPACGGDRNSPGGTGCPAGSHYGTTC